MLRMYSKDNCHFCVKAKDLLVNLGLSFEVIEINAENTKSLKALGVRTAPAMFDGDTYIGGFHELQQYVKDSQGNYTMDYYTSL